MSPSRLNISISSVRPVGASGSGLPPSESGALHHEPQDHNSRVLPVEVAVVIVAVVVAVVVVVVVVAVVAVIFVMIVLLLLCYN